MSFRKVRRPPLDKAIDLSHTPVVTDIIPPVQLFDDEVAFWRSKFDEADRAGEVVTRRTAEELVRGLGKISIGRREVLSLGNSSSFTAGILRGVWYARSSTLLAYSRMLREIDHPYGGFGFSADRTSVCFDFDERTTELHKSGMHIREGHAQDVLGLEPPGRNQSTWYEGKDVYLRITTPAQPTASLEEAFQGFYGEAFPSAQFSSVVARIKQDVWNAQP